MSRNAKSTGFRQRVIQRTHLGNITNVGNLWPDLRDREKVARYYLNYLMHEFCFTGILTRDQKESFLTAIRGFGIIPEEVIDYRLSCLKGEDSGPPPPAVFDYPPPHWGSRGVKGGYFPRWTYPPILPGTTTRKKDWKLEDYRNERRDELKHTVKTFNERIISYEDHGRALYPEYAFVTESDKSYVEFLKNILRDRSKRDRVKARRARKAA